MADRAHRWYMRLRSRDNEARLELRKAAAMGSSHDECVKFPRTPPPFGPQGTPDDNHLSEAESIRFVADESLIVEEKIDGKTSASISRPMAKWFSRAEGKLRVGESLGSAGDLCSDLVSQACFGPAAPAASGASNSHISRMTGQPSIRTTAG